MPDSVDRHLRLVLSHLSEHWMNEDVGIVAAGIFHSDFPPVLATSKKVNDEKWLHAEKNAFNQFVESFGKPSPQTLIVTTLSPCIKASSKSRHGASCTQLLMQEGIVNIRSGCLDLSQVRESTLGVEDYKEYGLNVTLTRDLICREICERLYSLFGDYGERINNDLIGIKRELGGQKFFEILRV